MKCWLIITTQPTFLPFDVLVSIAARTGRRNEQTSSGEDL